MLPRASTTGVVHGAPLQPKSRLPSLPIWSNGVLDIGLPATFSRAQVSRTGFFDNPTLLPRIEYSAERKPGRPLSLPQEGHGRQPRLTGMFQVSQRLFSPKPHHLTSPLSVF